MSDGAKQEHDNVVKYLCETNKTRFDILSNLESEKYYVGDIFPDIIFKDKASETPLFIVEVKRNGGIAQCLQQWKNAPAMPAPLYMIVPEGDLSNAKSIAQVVGLRVKFGSYSIDNSNQKIAVKYE